MTGRPDSLAQLVLLERPVHLDLQGRGDLLDKLVLRADKERKVRRVRLEPRGPLARLDPWDPRDPQGSLVKMGCVESLAQLVSKDFLVLLDEMALLDLWDPLDFLG